VDQLRGFAGRQGIEDRLRTQLVEVEAPVVDKLLPDWRSEDTPIKTAVTAIWARITITAWAKSRKTSRSRGRTSANSAVAWAWSEPARRRPEDGKRKGMTTPLRTGGAAGRDQAASAKGAR
jgi:hypothetical protein